MGRRSVSETAAEKVEEVQAVSETGSFVEEPTRGKVWTAVMLALSMGGSAALNACGDSSDRKRPVVEEAEQEKESRKFEMGAVMVGREGLMAIVNTKGSIEASSMEIRLADPSGVLVKAWLYNLVPGVEEVINLAFDPPAEYDSWVNFLDENGKVVKKVPVKRAEPIPEMPDPGGS